jgi:macrodomain Ter protein organizer (MatP/YcbG family)
MKTVKFTKEQLDWIAPFISEMLAEWKDQDIPEKHKYFVVLKKLAGKLSTIDYNMAFSKEEKNLFCGCINSRLETFYLQVDNSSPDSSERTKAENVIDITKDILEKCGYYSLNRHRSGENVWRYRERRLATDLYTNAIPLAAT